MTKDSDEKRKDDKQVDEQDSDNPLMQGFKKRSFTQAETLQILKQNKRHLERY